MKVKTCSFIDTKTEISFFQFIFFFFSSALAKPYRILCGAIGQGTWSLFVALGSHIILLLTQQCFWLTKKED